MSDSNKSVCMNCMLGDIDCTCIEPRKRKLSSPFQEEINKLKAENARYREALEFYASEKDYHGYDPVIISDGGDCAREALKGE